MQAVFLAAGRGTRMGELTKHTPKSLLEVAGKSLLERKFDALPSEIDEIVLVIGYLGEMIRAKFGDRYKGRKITYVEQKNPTAGTMDALLAAKKVLHGKFLATNGDDIHVQQDIEKCLLHEWALAVRKLQELGNASKVQVGADGGIIDIIEADTHHGGPGLGVVGLYVLNPRIFDVPPVLVTGRTETGLPQTMVAASRSLNIPITAVEIMSVIHITVPGDIVRAEKILGNL